jgi:hypothetical protein
LITFPVLGYFPRRSTIPKTMELYQSVQNRAMQTIAVINQHIPTLTVGGITAAALTSLANNLDATAAARDSALTDYDQAVNAENLGFLLIRRLTLALPQAAKGELNQEVPAEEALYDLLSPGYGITPSRTEFARARAQKIIPALTKINTFLAAQVPVRPAITSGGQGVAALSTALAAQPALEQAIEDRDADVISARNTLDTETHAVDQINKRFYQKLLAEARSNATLEAALSQIDTETDNLPGTLSIQSVLQGGVGQLHVLVSYVNGTGENADDRWLDWMVVGVDTDFTTSVAVDLSGNAIGPFEAGQTVRVRTRTVNSHGTRTSATRTLVIQVPV